MGKRSIQGKNKDDVSIHPWHLWRIFAFKYIEYLIWSTLLTLSEMNAHTGRLAQSWSVNVHRDYEC